MKVLTSENKIVVCTVFMESENNIDNYIKKLITKLKKKYKMSLSGFYDINVYSNKKVGMIIELIKDDEDSFYNILDVKVNYYKDTDIFLKFSDYYFDEKKDFYFFDNNYYIDINNLSYIEFLKSTEYSEFVYGNALESIKNKCFSKEY